MFLTRWVEVGVGTVTKKNSIIDYDYKVDVDNRLCLSAL